MNERILDELRQSVGPSFVLTDPGSLLLYSYDSALDRQVPSAVVLPGTPPELSKVVKILAKHKQVFVARGAGTSLCGAPIPQPGAVVVGLARLTRIGEVDKTSRSILVEPGVVNLKLQEKIAQVGFFYGPDPGSQKACTLGGNIGTNAGGPHCLKYGVTSNNVSSMDFILPDGQSVLLRESDPGYDLLSFFIGSEGTLGIASQIQLKLIPIPPHVRTMVASFRSIETAIQSVTDIIAEGILPATLEAMDKTVIRAVEDFAHAGYPRGAEAVLLIEVDGDDAKELDHQVQKIQTVCAQNNCFDYKFAESEAERKKLWEGRRGSYAAMARLAPNVLVEDGAVPRTKLPEATAAIQKIAEEHKVQVAMLFHAGDGNLHPQIIFDERDKKQTENVKEAGMKMLKACVDLGGTISGEHGIGQDKREAMKWLFTRETLSLFRRLKNIFDPLHLCNPDKMIPLVGASEDALSKGDIPVEQRIEIGIKKPKDEAEAVRMVKELASKQRPFGIQGTTSKFRIPEEICLSSEHLNKILDFDKGNLTITVQSGALISEVRKTVESSNQYLWVAGEGTVGGVIATRSSFLPPLRDQILGMRVLLSNGEIVQFGAKTMKNVAGYDAGKLLIGSWGTLGMILDVTFRLFPYAASPLQTQDIQLFRMNDIHKKIKRAFDPNKLLFEKYHTMKFEDLMEESKKMASTPQQEFRSINLDDKFWGGNE